MKVEQTKAKKSFIHADEQDEESKGKFTMSDLASLKRILYFAKKFKRGLITGLFLLLMSSLFSLGSARLMGALVEKGLIPYDLGASFRFSSIIILLEFFSLTSMWMGRKYLCLNSSLTILEIRKVIFNHLQGLPIGFYDRQPLGRIVTRVTHDIEGMEEFFTATLGRIINALFIAFMALIAMLVTDLKLGFILALSVAPAFYFVFITRSFVKKVNRNLSKTNSAVNSKLSELLNGMEVIRSNGLEDWSKKEYDEYVDEYKASHLKANTLYGWTRPFVAFLCSLPIIILVWFGGQKVIMGTMSVGLFVTFIRYCERFFNPIMTIAREVHVIQQAFTSIERVSSFLEHESEDYTLGKDGELSFNNLKGNIAFKNLWMSYNTSSERDESWVLNNLNFEVMAGQKVGLVGTTGCGKTTTVSLLSRLYEFQKGELLIDGYDIRRYQRAFLRNNIGFVSQDAIIFRGTFRENLTIKSKINDEDILKACNVTGLDRIMKEGGWTLDALIFEGGENLSVGERQLLSLTRVLLKNPSILILDEATANIDPWFEMIIHQAVDRVMEGRTCLIIAHRLSTLEQCDRILVFDKGRLMEEGSQKDLENQRGLFYQLQQASTKENLLS